jgi:hypothetical protein
MGSINVEQHGPGGLLWSGSPSQAQEASYPVSVVVEPQLEGRNRLTTAFRPILAIPHAILAGPVYWSSRTAAFGLIGAATYVLAIVSWVSLLITGAQPRNIREFTLYYLRWRTRSIAYMALLRDEYPPFGDGEYSARVVVEEPGAVRPLAMVALRPLLVIPHLVVVALLALGWFVTTIIAWLAILLTGSYPRGLYAFGVRVLRWALRVEAYALFLVDAYPPFRLE